VFGRASVTEPGYIHSFGLTENYFVLIEFPYVVNPLKLLFSGKPFIENFEWKPDRPARFMVFRRSDGALVAAAESEPSSPFTTSTRMRMATRCTWTSSPTTTPRS
jgi:carotenoid cleavage dioxygenase-like enzyme